MNELPAREKWRETIPGDMQGEVKAEEGDAVVGEMPGVNVGGWAGEGLERHGSAVVLKDGSEIDEVGQLMGEPNIVESSSGSRISRVGIKP